MIKPLKTDAMEEKLKISIKKPCAEKFENFRTTAKGGFCSACEKEVIDFSKMYKEEIVDYFSSSAEGTCGRFSQGQLQRFSYLAPQKRKRNSKFVYAGILSFSLLSLLSSNKSYGQDHMLIKLEQTSVDTTVKNGEEVDGIIVKGRVSADNEGLPFVAVHLAGSQIGINTDFDGYFTFPKALKTGEQLIFSYLGYQSVSYFMPVEVPSEISIVLSDAVECFITGEVSVEQAYSPSPTLWQKLKSLF